MIQCNDLKFSYSSKPLFCDNVSFEIPKGRIVGLLGKNGEGKTTLIKLISGQLLAKSGTLSVLGHNPKDRQPSFLENIFVVPEIVNVPSLKIKTYFESVSSFYPHFDKELCKKTMEIFDINEDMRLNSISQGQQKKAVLILAISLRPQLLLMDEPTNGLDIPSKSAFRQILSECIGEDQTVIISTHQVRDLEQLIDRIMILEKNKIAINEDLINLGKCFDFMNIKEAEGKTPIYSEGGPLGQVGVYDSEGESCTDFSIELFFNAMITNPEEMKNIISKNSK